MVVRDQEGAGIGSPLLTFASPMSIVLGLAPSVIWTWRGFLCSGLGIRISSTPRSKWACTASGSMRRARQPSDPNTDGRSRPVDRFFATVPPAWLVKHTEIILEV
jgi:hypothetical protein